MVDAGDGFSSVLYNKALAMTFGLGDMPMDYHGAVALLESAQRSLPDTDPSLCLLGYLYLKLSNYRFDSMDGKKATDIFFRSKDPRSQLYLGRMYMELSQQELSINEEKSKEYKEKSNRCFQDALRSLLTPASQKDPWSLELLAYMYDQGFGVKKDPKESLKWYGESAKQGNKSALSGVAICYSTGKNGAYPVDHQLAVKYFSAAAKGKGHPYAQTELAKYYLEGTVVEKDEKKAFELLRTAEATAGYSYTQLWLAKLYQHGRGTNQNFEEARRLFKLAASTGNQTIQTEAERELASLPNTSIDMRVSSRRN